MCDVRTCFLASSSERERDVQQLEEQMKNSVRLQTWMMLCLQLLNQGWGDC